MKQCIEQLYKNIFEQQELFDQKVIVEIILRLFVAALAWPISNMPIPAAADLKMAKIICSLTLTFV